MPISKKYDLEDRTELFAKKVRDYTKALSKSTPHIEYTKQLIRSSGSVAANYIEANESLGNKDFKMKVKICRKEAKESRLWIELTEPDQELMKIKISILDEASQLIRIFSTILKNTA